MAKKKGKPWTNAQRKKFAATMKRKKLNGMVDLETTSIPLDAIPARVKGKPAARKKGPVTAAEFALALDLLDLAVKMLRMTR